jgi:hypothetical protein
VALPVRTTHLVADGYPAVVRVASEAADAALAAYRRAVRREPTA